MYRFIKKQPSGFTCYTYKLYEILDTRKKWKIIEYKYPSFIKDSPSIIVLSFLLAPRSFNRATTATGSVALRSPPSNNDVFQLQLYGKVSCSIILQM
jgi:hypothetical protein